MNTNKTICTACKKRVYKLEELRVDKHVLHKGCFVCSHCKGKLSLSTFAAVSDKLYCKTHFMEIFAKSGGTYDAFNTPDAKSKAAEKNKVIRKESEEVMKPESKGNGSAAGTKDVAKKPDTEKVMSVQDRLRQYKEKGVMSSKPPAAPQQTVSKGTETKQLSAKQSSKSSENGSTFHSTKTTVEAQNSAEIERLNKKLTQEKAESTRLRSMVEKLKLENSQLKEKVSALEVGLREEKAKITAADEWCEKFKKELEMLDLPTAG